MKMDKLEFESKEWIEKSLEMKNGLIKWTIEEEGKYEFHLESRSINYIIGSAVGVNIKLKMNLKKNDILYLFIADTIFLFNKEKKLIAVPGAAAWSGDGRSNGSVNQDLQNSELFEEELEDMVRLGYDYQSVLNGKNRKESWTGSGFYNGHKYRPGYQGCSSYIDSAYESEIRQNTKIPSKGDWDVPLLKFTVPFIEIKLL